MRRRFFAIDLTAPPMQKLFARMAAAKTVYDPTLALMELFGHPAAELARREPGFAKMPRELRGSYGVGMDPEDVPTAPQAVREVRRHGARDAQARRGHRRRHRHRQCPGTRCIRELELYVEAGFTPAEAIAAATIVPARALGRDGELGTIAVGKRADLIVVDGNPLADIHALRRLKLTIARGRAYQPAAMWKLAGFQP